MGRDGFGGTWTHYINGRKLSSGDCGPSSVPWPNLNVDELSIGLPFNGFVKSMRVFTQDTHIEVGIVKRFHASGLESLRPREQAHGAHS